jgi:excisionase family DNA binding protein
LSRPSGDRSRITSTARTEPVVGRQLTLTDVAEVLRLRTKTFARYAKRGELVGRRIGRRWVFTQAAVDAFLEVMPEWLFDSQPRGLNGGNSGPWARGESDPGSSALKTPAATTSSKAQDAAEKFFQQMREKAANKPRDPLEPTKAETSRVRRVYGAADRYEPAASSLGIRRDTFMGLARSSGNPKGDYADGLPAFGSEKWSVAPTGALSSAQIRPP